MLKNKKDQFVLHKGEDKKKTTTNYKLLTCHYNTLYWEEKNTTKLPITQCKCRLSHREMSYVSLK